MKIYHWGIIGLGKIAHHFAKDLQRLPNAKLQAVASTSEERSQLFAQQYDVPFAFSSYEDIFNAPNLDAIYIATTHPQHYENTLLCLRNHIPVLCEKPLAMNHRQVKEMVAASKAHQTFLMEALWTRFLPPLNKALKIIESDRIGKVISVKADFGFKAPYLPESRLFNQDLGGGSLLDVGIYPVFLALFFLGKPDRIKASAIMGSTHVDEECGIILSYQSGKIAHLHSSIRHTTDTEAFIYGEKGTIHLHSRWHEPTNMSIIPDNGPIEDFFFDYKSKGYHYEAMEVMKCLERDDLESAMMPLDFSMALSELLDDIRAEAGIEYPRFDK